MFTNICFWRRTDLAWHFPAQTSANNAATAFLTNTRGRGSSVDGRRHTYPYFSARSRASSSLTALWSVRSHLLPHRITSGLSQYAWICSWPERQSLFFLNWVAETCFIQRQYLKNAKTTCRINVQKYPDESELGHWTGSNLFVWLWTNSILNLKTFSKLVGQKQGF